MYDSRKSKVSNDSGGRKRKEVDFKIDYFEQLLYFNKGVLPTGSILGG